MGHGPAHGCGPAAGRFTHVFTGGERLLPGGDPLHLRPEASLHRRTPPSHSGRAPRGPIDGNRRVQDKKVKPVGWWPRVSSTARGSAAPVTGHRVGNSPVGRAQGPHGGDFTPLGADAAPGTSVQRCRTYPIPQGLRRPSFRIGRRWRRRAAGPSLWPWPDRARCCCPWPHVRR